MVSALPWLLTGYKAEEKRAQNKIPVRVSPTREVILVRGLISQGPLAWSVKGNYWMRSAELILLGFSTLSNIRILCRTVEAMERKVNMSVKLKASFRILETLWTVTKWLCSGSDCLLPWHAFDLPTRHSSTLVCLIHNLPLAPACTYSGSPSLTCSKFLPPLIQGVRPSLNLQFDTRCWNIICPYL